MDRAHLHRKLVANIKTPQCPPHLPATPLNAPSLPLTCDMVMEKKNTRLFMLAAIQSQNLQVTAARVWGIV
jgi:hypothetical protein